MEKLMRKLCFIALCVVLCPYFSAQDAPTAQPTAPKEKARVFITDSESWESRGAAGGSHGSFAAQSSGGARPQTAEIIKTFGERCPDVIVNNKPDLADYIVVLDHEGGKGYLQHKNKVAVFDKISGDLVISKSTLSLGGSVEDACKGIAQNWLAHSNEMIAAKQKALIPAPAPANSTPVLVTVQSPAPVQASVTVDSTPTGADIEIDGAFVGSTPSTVTLAPGKHQVEVKKKGFSDWSKTLSITGGAIHLSAELEQAAAK
jgi:hypothetical protein